MKRPAFPVILLFIFIISVQSAQAAAKLTANSIWPKENLHSQFLHEYADRVQKATGGSIIIEVKDSNSLQFKGPDLLEAVRDNRVNISDMLITGVEDKEPFFQIITLPFFLKDLTAVQNFDQMARPYFDNYEVEPENTVYGSLVGCRTVDKTPHSQSIRYGWATNQDL